MAEKVLGELYAWDSAIEDDFARPEGERDEDRALEAYEEIIMAAGASEGDEAADQVLSLAAMLLTKHFFRFPHVQLNVVNALLQLCGAARAQAVRIHSVRSLLSIVKTPASDFVVPDVDNAIAWVQRIDDVVASMRADEASSSVLLRQISPLADALKVAMDMLQTRKLGKDDAGDQHQPEGDAQDGEGERERDRPAKKPKLSLEDEPMSPASGHHGNENASNNKREDDSNPPREWNNNKPQRDQNDPYARPFERKSAFSTSCPPGPHVFIGNIPTGVSPSDMLDFLSEVIPDLTLPCVQVKTNHSNTSSYAFISTDSVDMARKVIRFLSTTRYLDRKLNGRFARGPPVNTLTFVERTDNGELTSEADIQTRAFDFDNCDGNVWGKLMAQMERIGEFEVVARGIIRFYRTDDAKQAVQKHVFHVLGYEVIPIYEAEEQSIADAARRARETKQPFTLKSGRQVGEREFRSENYGGRYEDNRRGNDDRRGPNDNYRQRREGYQKGPSSPRAEYTTTRSPSPKPSWRNSGPRQRDTYPPSNQETSRRARSPGFRPHSPTPAASHRSRSPPPRAQSGRSRSPVDTRRYDGPTERRSSRTNSPGALPPNQRSYPASQRRDRSPPRAYADEPEPKSSFQPREDRGRPREREQYPNRSRGPNDFRDDRETSNTRGDGPPRFEPGPPSGFKRNTNRFNNRNDGSPFRNSPVGYRQPQAAREPVEQRRSRSRSRSPPPLPKFGGSRPPPPPDHVIRQTRPDDRREMRDNREDKTAWRDNRKRDFRQNEHDDRPFVRDDRFSKRDEISNVRDDQPFERDGPSGRPFKSFDRPFKNGDRPPFKPNNDRPPFKNYDRPFKPNDRPPFKPNDRSFGRDDGRDEPADRRDFRSGNDRPAGRDFHPAPRHDRDSRDDFPMDQDNARGRENRPLWRNKGPNDRQFGRNGPADRQRPAPRDNGESDEGVARYGAPSGDRRSRSPPRQSERRPSSSGHSSPRNEQPAQSRNFEPRERRTPSQFSNKSDNFRGDAPRENRQYTKPSPRGTKPSPRGSFRGSPIQTREPSVDERSSKSHTPRESRNKHSARDDDRRREGKRSRNDDLSSPVASKRARSMSPSPARKSASVAGSERGKPSTRAAKSADDPFAGMDELTVDYEEDD